MSRLRRLWVVALVWAVAASVAVVTPDAVSAGPSSVRPATTAASAAASEEAAVAKAVRLGQRVEVLAARTAFTQVFAEPSGRLTYEAAVVPQRTRRADGSWADIDLSLRAGPDGRLRPGASTADVRFSGGGAGPLVTMVEDGRTLTLTWPGGALPTPSVSGDSATYAEVLPSVDLVVRATATGFTHVLVVKARAAAASAAVRQVRFALGGDVAVSRRPDGGLRAMAGSTLIASAEPPVMWDSSSADASTASTPAMGARSSHAGAGDTARTAAVGTELTSAGDLVLRPDPALLAADAVFPVYIDPAWSKYRSRWAYATSNNSNNTDTSVARVGKDPNSSLRYRSFFEFPTSEIKGKHIESAYVQMKLDHSWSCGNTSTSMYYSAALTGTPRTAWSTRLISSVASAQSHANEGDGCSDSPQPDMTVNFINAAVTSMVQNVANNGYATVTVGFCACGDEGNEALWKKFFPGNAKLIADVDAKPGKPTGLQVSGVACTTAGISIGTLTPTLSAVFPDADGGQAIRGTWEWLEVPTSGTWNDSTPRKTPPAQTSVPAAGRATTSALSGLATPKKYAFRVKGTDPAPYSITGPWSDWCVFWPDTTVPTVTVTPGWLPSGPGTTGSFRFVSSADVVKFRYGWTDAVIEEVAAQTGTYPWEKVATVSVTPPRYGTSILYVQAIDATNNKGYGSIEFTVGRPSPAVARWGLETYPGVSQAAALADQQPALSGDTPLTGTLLGWTSDARLVGGQTVRFAGGSSQAVASGLTPNTTTSFSVATWVRLQATTGSQTFISKDGGPGEWSVFRLQWRGDGTEGPRWCFMMATTLTVWGAQSLCTPAPDSAGRWTHVAASYDSAEKKMRLWVDGAPTEVAFATPVTSAGPIVLGRGVNAGSPADRTYGEMADVQLFNRVLVDHDFTGQLADDPESGGFDEPGILQPILSGQWDFDVTQPCYEFPTVFNNCVALPADNWGRRLLFNLGTDVDGGRQGAGVLLDRTHWAPEGDPYYGRGTYEYGLAQRNTAPDGQPQTWQNAPVLRTDQSFTVSVWVRPDRVAGGNMTAVAQQGTAQSKFLIGTRNFTSGGVTVQRWGVWVPLSDASSTGAAGTTMARALTDDDTAVWTHLVVAYDVRRKQIRLYVNGNLEGSAAESSPWPASGPLTVGAALWSPAGDTPRIVDGWYGGIDDLMVFQGAMTDAQAHTLYDQQVLPSL